MTQPRTQVDDPEKQARDKIAKERADKEKAAQRLAMLHALASSFTTYSFVRRDQPDQAEEERKKIKNAIGGNVSTATSLLGEGVLAVYKDKKEIPNKALYYSGGMMTLIHKNEAGGQNKFDAKDAEILIAAGVQAGLHVHVIGFGDPKTRVNWNDPNEPGKARNTLKHLGMMMDAAEKKGMSVAFDENTMGLLQYFDVPTQKKFFDRKILLDQNRFRNEALAGLKYDAHLVKNNTDITSQVKPTEPVDKEMVGKSDDKKVELLVKRLEDLEKRKDKAEAAIQDVKRHVENDEKILDSLTQNPTAFRLASNKQLDQKEVSAVFKQAEDIRLDVDRHVKHNEKNRDALLATVQTERNDIEKEVQACKDELANIKLPPNVDEDVKKQKTEATKKISIIEKSTVDMKKTADEVQVKAGNLGNKLTAAEAAIDKERNNYVQPGRSPGKHP